MTHGHPRLLHGRGGEGWEADDVPRRVDVLGGGAVVGVHREQAAIVDVEAGALERQPAHVGDATAGHQDGIHLEPGAALEIEANAVGVGGVARHALAQPHIDAEELHLQAQAVGDLHVEKGEQAIAAVDQRHPDAEGGEHGGVLAPDDARADHGERGGQPLHGQDLVAVVHARIRERDVPAARGYGAGGDEDHLSVQHALGAVGGPHADGVRILEARLAADEVDGVALDVGAHHLAQRAHDLLLAVHEVVHREVGLDVVIDAVEPPL